MNAKQALIHALTNGARVRAGNNLMGFDGIEGTGFAFETETQFIVIDVNNEGVRVEVHNIDTDDLEDTLVLVQEQRR